MNNEINLKKKFASAAEQQINKPENQSADTEQQYTAPVEKLEQRQTEANVREELEKQEIEDRKSNRKLREKYVNRMFWYMCIWSVFISGAITFSGLDTTIEKWKFSFHLDNLVLITLISGATASIFAIIFAIIKGIFKG